jgi:pimeloyl-ACP methyl ester carboxylesterase
VIAAYEMPHAIVSPSPATSIQALQTVVDDFLDLMVQRDLDPANLTLMGLSIGNFAATYLANMIGARLWAIAPGDRGEVLLWSSSFAASLRKQAEARGYSYSDFEAALRDFNPINNLRNIGAGSVFIAGRFDNVVPYSSATNIAAEARASNPSTRTLVLPLGHSGTLFAGVQYLRLKLRYGRC